jgi:hypothetical protein
MPISENSAVPQSALPMFHLSFSQEVREVFSPPALFDT